MTMMIFWMGMGALFFGGLAIGYDVGKRKGRGERLIPIARTVVSPGACKKESSDDGFEPHL